MNQLPLVSVVSPCYNGDRYLEDFFESLLAQTYIKIEVIFVNDGSKDNTENIALSYKNKFEDKGIRFIYLYQKNSGQSEAINNGLKYIKGKYLIWPDSDDVLEKESIRARVNFLENNPSYDIVRSNGYIFDDGTKKVISRISNNENRFNEDIFLDLIEERTFCACGTYMIKTQALQKVYDDLRIPNSNSGQNWQILVPICGNSKCGFIDEDYYGVRVHIDSHSRKNRETDEQIERFEELERILLVSIERSGRKDRNYKNIVRVKTLKLSFLYFLNKRNKKICKKYLKLLKLQNYDIKDLSLHYYKVFNPFIFKVKKVFLFSDKFIRWIFYK